MARINKSNCYNSKRGIVMTYKRFFSVILIALSILLSAVFKISAAEITDDAGQKLVFDTPPARVVSLLPSVTEVICCIGAESSLVGVTYHDTGFEGTAGKVVIGGAFTPRFEIINGLSPDLLIVAPRDFDKAKKNRAGGYHIIAVDDNIPLTDAERWILKFGEIFGRRGDAERVTATSRELMEIIRLKTDKIPQERRRKVMYLTLGATGLMTPGDKSFQNETIRAAGGVTGEFGDEPYVTITLDRWLEFNPDFVYATSVEYAEVSKLLSREGWRDVSAVKNHQVFAFPSALVCRAAAHVGYFIAWLSSEIYVDDFADSKNLTHPQEIISEQTLSLDVPYVEKVRVIDSRIMDFVHRTLLVDFKRPQSVVSTVYGERHNIEHVGNSYSPTPTWSIYHKLGFEKSQEDLFSVLALDNDKAELMLTGADINNAVIKTASYRDMKVTAIVTAGVESNALRTSKDVGAWYEPGTINILLMTNHKLSEQAATRAIITVTEAKTAALWDMDVRSSQSRAFLPATGTGTDSVIVVSGEGVVLHGSGGHTKIGELIADAVYRGVHDAILKQNGKKPIRNTLERLEERGIPVHSIIDGFQAALEELLLSPEHKSIQGFLESAFSLSDAHVMGQISNLDAFDAWALSVAENIAGCPVSRVEAIISHDDMPPVLKTALDAIATGLRRRAGLN